MSLACLLQKQAVCVLVTRIFGNMMAEVPVVSTKESARRQGHARRLMHALEELLKKVRSFPKFFPRLIPVNRTSFMR